jgi:hypothetical protein
MGARDRYMIGDRRGFWEERGYPNNARSVG